MTGAACYGISPARFDEISPLGNDNFVQLDLAKESEISDFVTVCKEVDLPAGAIRKVEVQGQTIVLYNVGGKLYATQQECLHRQGPLDEGELQGTVITCPWHGRARKLKTYAVRNAGGEVQVAL
ncbi:Rieske 2Fe-2S domain-containing protein [candidate division KSB1 bacterium]|nr:Rieske 2Fe-2S domain-containing protein [candidate division KSB1 bacterium]